MDELLVGCRLVCCVFLGGKAGEAFLEEVHFEGIKAGYQGVYPEIEFESVNEEGV